MGALLLSRDVPGTLESLFNTIVAPTTWDHWFGMHHDFIGTPPERLVEGSVVVAEVLLHGMLEEVEWTVTRLDRPNRIALRGKGRTGIQYDLTYWLQSTESGANITAGFTFSGPLITNQVTKALEQHGYEQLDNTLGQLAELACARHE